MKRLVSFGGVGSVAVLLLLFAVSPLFSEPPQWQPCANDPAGQWNQPTPEGTAGVLDTVCNCGQAWGDLTNDGSVNPVDMVEIVNIVYKCGGTGIYPIGWNCPTKLGDVTCDGAINPVDVVRYVHFVYRGRNEFCPNPCGS